MNGRGSPTFLAGRKFGDFPGLTEAKRAKGADDLHCSEAAAKLIGMYLRLHRRLEDGKEHRDRSVVESKALRWRSSGAASSTYVGEINDSLTMGVGF